MRTRTAIAGIVALGLGALAASGKPLHLRVGVLGPSSGDGATAPPGCTLPASSPAPPDSPDLFLVQLTHVPDEAARATLIAQGCEPLAYVPLDGLACRATPRAMVTIAQRADVSYATWLAPCLRVHAAIASARATADARALLVEGSRVEDLQALAARAGIKADEASPLGSMPTLRLRGDAASIAALASRPDVLLIEPWADVRPQVAVARTSADVPTGRGATPGPLLDVERAWDKGLRGAGEISACGDTGLDAGQVAPNGGVPGISPDFGVPGDATNPFRIVALQGPGELAPGLAPGWSDDDGHGTAVAGLIAGNGTLSGSAPQAHDYATSQAGIAPEAGLVVQKLWDPAGSFAPATGPGWRDGFLGMAHAEGARVVNASWGADAGGEYDIFSAQLDDATWALPDLAFVASAGNNAVDGDLYSWNTSIEQPWETGLCGQPWVELMDYPAPCAFASPWPGLLPFWTSNPQACTQPYLPNLLTCVRSQVFVVDPANPPAEVMAWHDLDLADAGDQASIWLQRPGMPDVRVAQYAGPIRLLGDTLRAPLPATGWASAARLRFETTTDASGDGIGWSLYWVAAPNGVMDEGSLLSPASAKNAIAVGATENRRPGVREDVAAAGDCGRIATWGGTAPIDGDEQADDASGMASFSSRGPCADGRIKPDVAAPGTFVLAPVSRGVDPARLGWNACDIPAGLFPDYGWFGGTSCAAPLVTGVATLVREYFADGWHARGSLVAATAPAPADGFAPSSALVKATILAGAWPLAPGQHPAPDQEVPDQRPNAVAGFGRIDAMGSMFPAEAFGGSSGRRLLALDETDGLANGVARTHRVTLAPTAGPLTIVLAWTDPPASPMAGRALVNDLALQLRLSDGTVIDGSNGNGANDLDNVERILLPAGAATAGPADIVVRGISVPGVPAWPGSDRQPYAIAAIGDFGCAPPPGVTGLRVTKEASGGVALSWTPAAGDLARHAVARVDRVDDFASPAVLARPARASHVQAGAATDGAAWAWLVASENRCGELSSWR